MLVAAAVHHLQLLRVGRDEWAAQALGQVGRATVQYGSDRVRVGVEVARLVHRTPPGVPANVSMMVGYPRPRYPYSAPSRTGRGSPSLCVLSLIHPRTTAGPTWLRSSSSDR